MTVSRGFVWTRFIVNEEWRNARYADSLGNPTIGVGHLLHVDDDTTQYWTDSRVAWHLRQDIELAVRNACRAAHDNGLDFLAAALQRNWDHDEIGPTDLALIDMAFTLGAGGLARFHGMWGALKRDNRIRAGDEVLFVDPDAFPAKAVSTPYAMQTGHRARDNAYMIRTRTFPDWGAVPAELASPGRRAPARWNSP